MPTPYGCRSPDVQLPGPELSRGFSRSASRPSGRSLVALSPDGLAHASGRRGGCTSAGTWPASHASGSFQISAFLRLDVTFMAQTGTCGAAASELLVSCAEFASNRPANSKGKKAISVISAFLSTSYARCSLGFVVTQCSSLFPAHCQKNGVRAPGHAGEKRIEVGCQAKLPWSGDVPLRRRANWCFSIRWNGKGGWLQQCRMATKRIL